MGSFFKFQTALASRGRWPLAFLWLGIVIGAVFLLPKLDFRFNLGKMLRGDESRMEEVKTFYRTFPPSEGHLVVSATFQEPLTINRLRQTADWAKSFKALPEVREVISVDKLLELKMDGFTLDQWAFLGGTGDELLELGDGPGMGTFKGNLVSRDLKSVALYLIKEKGVSRSKLHRAVEGKLKTPPWESAEVRMVGLDYLLEKMGVLLQKNFSSLMWTQMLALIFIVPFFMRSLRRAYLPLLISASALVIYLGIFILVGKDFEVMHLAGPGLILIIGLADAIHLQQKFDDARSDGHDPRSALSEMFGSVGKACALTSLTTACGFLSLTVSRHEEIFSFGLWCAIGVLTSYVVVMVFLPVALMIFPGKGDATPYRKLIGARHLRKFAAPVTVLLVVLAAGTFRTEIDSSLDRELPEDEIVVQNMSWFTTHFRGIDRIEVDLKADLRDPDVFAIVGRMQDELSDFPGISGSRSYVDAIHMALAPDVVETEDGPVLGVQALGSGSLFPHGLMTRDLNRACIVFYRTRDFGTSAYELFRDKVKEFEGEMPPGAKMKLNGSFPMYYDSTTLISKTLALSLTCSLGMITLILIFVLKSFRLAILCLVPNAIPLLVVSGITGWLGESLHLGILIVFSIGLGLAVDDTIHLMVRFKQLQKEKPDGEIRELMDEALSTTGFAIILTSLVLLIVATCFLGSNFTTMRWTGLTLGIVAVTAVLADLIVLPWLVEKCSLVLWRKPKTASL